MSEDLRNVQPGNNDQPNRESENTSDENNERFESDTQKIVRRHLENKDDIITDEDIASVRIGMSPPPDEPTAARFGKDEDIDKVEEEELGDDVEDIDEEENTRGDKASPWDTIEPDR